MQKVPMPDNEQERLRALVMTGMLDTAPEERFDRITQEATRKLGVPISTVSLLDKNREWFKSCVGLDTKEGPREISFCGHALLAREIFIVEDTLLDERFKDNPYVTGKPFVRFYAGVALHNLKNELPIGVFCVKDIKPRKLSSKELEIMFDLAAQAEAELNLPAPAAN